MKVHILQGARRDLIEGYQREGNYVYVWAVADCRKTQLTATPSPAQPKPAVRAPPSAILFVKRYKKYAKKALTSASARYVPRLGVGTENSDGVIAESVLPFTKSVKLRRASS